MVNADPKYKKPITSGFDFNFFHEETVTSGSFGDAIGDANFVTGVRASSMDWYLTNTGANPVEYSLNGNTLHGRIAGNSEKLFRNRPIYKIWFRVLSGSTTVELEGWATR